MSSEKKALIIARNLGKSYEIYQRPSDRLKQILWGNSERRYFREFHALSGVSFEVQRGVSLGVIGRNGAGKSTLLQLITGTLEPTVGSVEVTGKVAAVLELGAGFSMEFSGRENIELYCNLLQMPPAVIRERFDRIVAFSELEQFIDQPLKTYSSGMVARLAFSVIAHVDAEILIIDEVLSVGDAAFSQKCMRFLHGFRRRGTIFFVSHDLSAVKAFSASAIWLDGGKVRAFGDSRAVCDAYMSDIYPNSAPVKPSEDIKQLPESEGQPKVASSPVSTLRVPRQPGDKSPDSLNTLPHQGWQNIGAFSFNSASAGFGNHEAEIVSVSFADGLGNSLAFCQEQQEVVVTVRAAVHTKIASPIVGFHVKDRLGQPLFGANTYLAYRNTPVGVEAGQVLEATFVFNLPTLMLGDYSITAAIAEGSLQFHRQLHWLHDAALFEVTGSTLDGVLVGIPMQRIKLKTLGQKRQKTDAEPVNEAIACRSRD